MTTRADKVKAFADGVDRLASRVDALAVRADAYKGPQSIKYKGKEYWATGKTGKHIKTGTDSGEYRNTENNTDDRLWRRATGEIDPD